MLNEFKKYLLENGNTAANQVPYYLRWVADCYSFLDIPDTDALNSDQRKRFLARMAKTHEEWQVKQADTALRFYHYFLSRGLKKSDAAASISLEWKALEEKLREALRLRHRAYSTEKTYVIWIRGFRSFVNSKEPAQLEGSDLQN